MTGSRVFDCLVFSGGGAKGAYGAGAAKALWEYRALKRIDTELCYLGASAGAINAALLAMYGADDLVRFWRREASERALGTRIRGVRLRSALSWLRRRWPFGDRGPYSVYSNRSLAALLAEHADLARLAGKHLIVAATDFSAGRLRAFYHSHLLDRFVAEDREAEVQDQRLSDFLRLDSANLVPALLASSALPVFYPPVRIDGTWYIDGGVGNNTPTAEAARFLRHVESSGEGSKGTVYCVRLEPPRLRDDTPDRAGILALIDRTMSIYHELHTGPIVGAWYRINREVRNYKEARRRFVAFVKEQDWSAELKQEVIARAKVLSPHGGATERVETPLLQIRPSVSLGGTLDFSARRIDENIKIGFRDMLIRLQGKGRIDEAEHERLLEAEVLID